MPSPCTACSHATGICNESLLLLILSYCSVFQILGEILIAFPTVWWDDDPDLKSKFTFNWWHCAIVTVLLTFSVSIQEDIVLVLKVVTTGHIFAYINLHQIQSSRKEASVQGFPQTASLTSCFNASLTASLDMDDQGPPSLCEDGTPPGEIRVRMRSPHSLQITSFSWLERELLLKLRRPIPV